MNLAVLVGLLAICYGLVLFSISVYADKFLDKISSKAMVVLLSLSLAVYCSAWSFLGSISQAATDLWSFVPIFLAPILIFTAGFPIIKKMAIVSKAQNITSMADFIAARYGKSKSLAAFVSIFSFIGILPYITLQLKALISSLYLFQPNSNQIDISFYAILTLISFTILFGTRKLDATEHNKGMILAIACESVFKLAIFIGVSCYIVYFIFNGANDIWVQAQHKNIIIGEVLKLEKLFPALFLCAAAFFCMPRLFHLLMIESQSEETLDQVRWIFPVYLILSAIFIVPLALAGKLLLPDSTLTDSYILNIPLLKGEVFIAIIALFGTFSAVIGMLIVSVLTISIMISNEVITPFLLKSGHLNNKNFDQFSSFLLNARRIIISIVFLCGYLMYKSSATHYSLASFGILAFGALAQFSPALIGGIYWIHGNRKGVFLGLIVGFTIWSNSFIHTIFVFEPTKHDISNSNLKIAITALLANILCYILGSLWTKARLVERIQASKFVSPGVMRQVNRTISQISQQDLYLITSRFIDPDLVYKTMTSFDSNFEINTKLASIELIAHTEHMIAKVLGTSSAALVIDSISLGRDLALDEVLNLMNEASSKINLTQEMLIAAIENANEAISIVDKNLNLVAWNHKYEELYEYPDNFLQIGMPIAKVILFNAQRGYCGPGDNNQLVTKRIQHLRNGTSHTSERQLSNGKVIKINGNPMPGGGFVVTFNDITQYRQQEHALREINETLEERVDNRTLELAKLNSQLIQAKEQEEKANASKSRFLAAVGHDLMQPLNAARLFTASLSQHPNLDQDARTTLNHANNSLKIAGELLIDLLDISKLDSNLTTANKQHFALSDILDSSVAEFKAMSGDSQIQFKCIPTKVIVYSDPHLLRRVIQNFLTNAFRYAKGARVLLGIRRRLDNIEIQVLDTGCGIAKTDLNEIFKEFKRLDNPKSQAVSGLGLGLAIADRISKVLNHTINVQSIHGKGSVFSITVPRSKQQNTIPSPSTAKLLNPLTGVKVLAIDNEESILNGLESLLTRWHCEVICAQDLASAKIKLGLKGVAPDIILADYHLDDDKNGLDAMDEIRKTYGAIPGILITADTQKVIIDEASTRNYSYMQKMIKPASLKMLIASLITKT